MVCTVRGFKHGDRSATQDGVFNGTAAGQLEYFWSGAPDGCDTRGWTRRGEGGKSHQTRRSGNRVTAERNGSGGLGTGILGGGSAAADAKEEMLREKPVHEQWKAGVRGKARAFRARGFGFRARRWLFEDKTIDICAALDGAAWLMRLLQRQKLLRDGDGGPRPFGESITRQAEGKSVTRTGSSAQGIQSPRECQWATAQTKSCVGASH
ncbi:hypothetical protein B0H17DRAFT_1123565 [Mycena rosella]|uniref:Uncharacterized protein n=1 Tax=Mycena rosella TaxID=1033263 RepID=A0AAD7H2F4_MYCRO|nr:hypothetical protein B0H17DRAFT_1123565 [Mycena rosella]